MRVTDRIEPNRTHHTAMNHLEDSSHLLRTDGGRSGPLPDSLIVVSNRQPYRHEWEDSVSEVDSAPTEDERHDISVAEPNGGLTAGLDPVMRTTGGTWIAWGDGNADRAVTDDTDCVAVPPGTDDQYTLRRVWLSEEAVDGYYTGYSNRVLWPLCHGLTDYVEFRPSDLEWYRRANRQFADAVLEQATDESVIWLQDYHLGLAPSMIREDLPSGATIAQFWHIPWPDLAAFRDCPNGRELLEGLLGNHLLGFHVERYGTNFLDCIDALVPGAAVDYRNRTVRYEGTVTEIVSTPMGVDADTYDERAREVPTDRWDALRERYDIPADCAVGLGVDRLDYTKGIPERLAALEHLFEAYPSWRESFTFVQKSTPSRTTIPAYERHGATVREAVDRLNERFGTESWRPVVYTEEVLDHADLTTLYREADVMIVSSLQDGMNLVAQEYVAASLENDGALVLSQETGAADVLGYPAHTVDPTDVKTFARTIADALSTTDGERRSRMAALRTHVFEYDLEWWMDEQFAHIANRRRRLEYEQPNGPNPSRTT